jgi:hypothetical protein
MPEATTPVRTHSYFLWLEGEPLPWDPHDGADLPLPDCAYIGGVFREFERRWTGRPLTVYLTRHTTALPSYGDDVVVVLLNEEWFRTPAYTGCVLAVIRNLPEHPWFPWSTLAPPTVSAGFAWANYLRVLAERRWSHRGSERVRAENNWPPRRTDNNIDIPLGYYRQPTKPIKSFEERSTDVFFAGSLLHDMERKGGWKRAVKRVAGNPKQVYRKSMLDELERFRSRHPDLRATVTVTRDFRDLERSDVTNYAEDMMNARIALVPRGTAAESYRLFEAWRYGCIVICEQLPPRPFLQGAPAITLNSWRELEPALDSLLADPMRQRELHEASLRWWRNVCSEEAIGRRLAEQLSSLSRRSA